MTTILVTGADGFLGRGLCAALESGKVRVRRAVRSEASRVDAATVVTGDLARFTDWAGLVGDVDAVAHLAGRAHITAKDAPNDVASYRPVNVLATVRLAEAAIERRVRRFLFVSSIGVNGNRTHGEPFTESSTPAPVEAYAISKWEAEQALSRMLVGTATELVVVRPTLVYGPQVKGNLLRLMQLLATGRPIPLGSLRAPRNLIGRDNLCDLLLACLEHPAAGGETFLAAEPEPQSTALLLERIAARMPSAGPVWQWPMPLLRLAATLAGKRAELYKLSSALEVSPAKAMSRLGWRPMRTAEAGLAAMVDAFLDELSIARAGGRRPLSFNEP